MRVGLYNPRDPVYRMDRERKLDVGLQSGGGWEPVCTAEGEGKVDVMSELWTRGSLCVQDGRGGEG